MSRTPFQNQLHGPPSLVDAITAPHNFSLLSPPETDLIHDHLSAYEDHCSPPDQVVHETPVSRIRRPGMPNVTYTNGSLATRDSRTFQRQSKWLLMVFPPKSLNKEPPILGHTLSSAPAGRFSNGILMPLFPTLYTQLTAIAREYNMPSITGLCLYLQVHENNKPLLTPRISDETWQILWASCFTDDRSVHIPSHGLPICGQVEFDIDLARAKWYNAWMGFNLEGISREPSAVPSHWRGESRTSFFHPELTTDDNPSPPQDTAIPNLARRQAPRPLILHQRSSSRHSVRHVFPDVSDQHENFLPSGAAAVAAHSFVPNTLSPMVPELEEPQTSKSINLNTMVRKWRESSIIASTAPSVADASTHERLNTNTVSEPYVELKLDLGDFTWSVSSAGPPSQSSASPGWPEKLPSIHLASRMQASRCNTPTTCTSWGPPVEDDNVFDYDRLSYHLPSPDMGRRTLDFVPLTPSTCTSWGPDDILSPVFSYSSAPALSLDMGIMVAGSAPVTPSTCTTWGPADTPIPSPQTPTHPPSPYIDERVRDDSEEIIDKISSSFWPHVWPYNRSSVLRTSIPWTHVWPYVQSLALDSVLTSSEHTSSVEATLEQYPSLKCLYSSQLEQRSDVVCSPWNYAPSYPIVKIYDSVYPHNLTEIYPVIPSNQLIATKFMLIDDISDTNSSESETTFAILNYPLPVVYPPIYPHNLDLIYPVFDKQSHSLKPTDVYTSVYATTTSQRRRRDVDGMPSSTTMTATYNAVYPQFDLYPSVYPFNLNYIYPKNVADLQQQPLLSERTIPLHAQYPSFIIYPPVYPFNLAHIYPFMNPQIGSIVEQPVARSDSMTPQYPVFDIYPAVYPLNLMAIYPATAAVSHSVINVDMDQQTNSLSIIILLRTQYPLFEIYPAVYPHSLDSIYPVAAEQDGGKEDVVSLTSNVSSSGPQYPFFDIYPSLCVYPEIVLYGTVYRQTPKEDNYAQTNTCVLEVATSSYPLIDIYPPVYSPITEHMKFISFSPASMYDIYPPVYPFNLENIYDAGSLFQYPISAPAVEPQVAKHATDYGIYPHLTVYSIGYPQNLDYIYESAVQSPCSFPTGSPITPCIPKELKNICENTASLMEFSQGYPTFTLYPPLQGYPDFVLYPSLWHDSVSDTEENESATPAVNATYPTSDFHPLQLHSLSATVHSNIVPTMSLLDARQVKQKTFWSVDYRYPFLDVYPAVYPFLDPYPKLQPLVHDNDLSSTQSNLLARTKRYTRGIKRQPSERSSPPPLPIKPGTLKSFPSRSNFLEVASPVKRKRTHHELYMSVIDDVQHALEGQASFEFKRQESELQRITGLNQRPSLLRKPTVTVPRYPSSTTENRLMSTPLTGLRSSPEQTRTLSTFAGHVSSSIHSRVQSMHSQSRLRERDETDRATLQRSRSLLNGPGSVVHDRAKLYSVEENLRSPPLAPKPSIKLTGSYDRNHSL